MQFQLNQNSEISKLCSEDNKQLMQGLFNILMNSVLLVLLWHQFIKKEENNSQTAWLKKLTTAKNEIGISTNGTKMHTLYFETG